MDLGRLDLGRSVESQGVWESLGGYCQVPGWAEWERKAGVTIHPSGVQCSL